MTDGTTTIQIADETKAQLDARKTGGESYDDVVRRVLEGTGVLHTDTEIREIAREVVRDEIENSHSPY